MEASALVRSGSFRFKRSTSVGRLPSPRPVMVHMAARDCAELAQLRRARSETDLVRSGSTPASLMLLPVPVEKDDQKVVVKTSEMRKRPAFSVQGVVTKEAPLEGIEEEEKESFGSGIGKGGDCNRGGKGGRGSGDQSENRRIHDRYAELLKSDPGNSLLLRNYGKFLYEVEGDVKGAEECYGRAILASPGDGEVLMLYGMLVWENYREKERAGAYLQRATELSPDDCMVLAAHAKFLWEVGDDEDEDHSAESMVPPSQPLVAAF